jgi:hypothetical protein
MIDALQVCYPNIFAKIIQTISYENLVDLLKKYYIFS